MQEIVYGQFTVGGTIPLSQGWASAIISIQLTATADGTVWVASVDTAHDTVTVGGTVPGYYAIVCSWPQ
jgi:hypothetical protein